MAVQDLRSQSEGVASLEAAINDAYYPFEITELTGSVAIECGMESKAFGAVQVSHLKSNAPYCGRSRRSRHGAERFVLHVMEEGSVVFNQRQNTVKAQAGALVLINPDPTLQTEKLSATQAFAIAIPAQLLTMYFPDARNWELSMRGSGLGTAAVLRDMLQCSWRQRDLIRPAEAAHLSRALIQLIGATFGDHDEHRSSCGSRSMQLHYMRIRDFVIQNLENEEISADFIADKVGISKSYLFAILKKADTTLGRLILGHRLERCRAMLIDPDMDHVSISEMAYSVGFCELPHFSRCFTKQYGQSPRAYRKGRPQELSWPDGRQIA